VSGLKYSQNTLEAIAKIEEEGMDFIDYDLILSVIVYICNKFDSSLLDGAAISVRQGQEQARQESREERRREPQSSRGGRGG
jgi:hypothetical protein